MACLASSFHHNGRFVAIRTLLAKTGTGLIVILGFKSFGCKQKISKILHQRRPFFLALKQFTLRRLMWLVSGYDPALAELGRGTPISDGG